MRLDKKRDRAHGFIRKRPCLNPIINRDNDAIGT